MLKIFEDEIHSCLYSILKEPTDIAVDYYFDRISDCLQALREYVDTCKEIANGGKKQ